MKFLSISLLFAITSLPLLAQERSKIELVDEYSFLHTDIFDYRYYFCDSCALRVESHSLTLNFIGGFSNNHYGLVIGTFFNAIQGSAYGVQLAGVINYAKKKSYGLSIAGLHGFHTQFNGLQLSGISYSRQLRGAQVGVFNTTIKFKGIQLGGFNRSDNINGVQIALAANGTSNETGNLKGGQIGFFNNGNVITKIGLVNNGESKFQVGFANFSSSNNYPIGLINIIENGEITAGLNIDGIGNAIAQFRSGGKALYGILGIGYNLQPASKHSVIKLGLGGNAYFTPHFRMNLEFAFKPMSIALMASSEKELKRRRENHDFKEMSHYSFALLPSFKFLKTSPIEFYIGPTFNFLTTNSLENENIFPSKHVWRDFNEQSLHQLYIGFEFGFRYDLNVLFQSEFYQSINNPSS